MAEYLESEGGELRIASGDIPSLNNPEVLHKVLADYLQDVAGLFDAAWADRITDQKYKADAEALARKYERILIGQDPAYDAGLRGPQLDADLRTMATFPPGESPVENMLLHWGAQAVALLGKMKRGEITEEQEEFQATAIIQEMQRVFMGLPPASADELLLDEG